MITNYTAFKKGNVTQLALSNNINIIAMTSSIIPETVVPLTSSSNGRSSGKPWKSHKSATVYAFNSFNVFPIIDRSFASRSHMPEGVKTKSWEDRMEKTKKEMAIKKLQTELKDEKQAEITR